MATRNRTIALSQDEIVRLSSELAGNSGGYDDPIRLSNRLIHDDSLVAMALMPDEVFDLIVTDPPYSIRKTFGVNTFESLDRQGYCAYLRTWVPQLYRLMKTGGSLYVCGDWRSSGALEEVLSEYFTLRNRITWEREKGRGALKNWKNASEDIWYCTKGEGFFFDAAAVRLRRRVIAPYRSEGQPRDWVDGEVPWRDTAPSNLLTDCTVPFWSMAENTPHPTQKPEKLIAKLVLASSRPGDLVFDPFAGSGTTGVVAKKLGRRYCLIEREAEYIAYTQARLNAADHDQAIQGFKDGIFYDRNFGKGTG